MVVSSNLNPPHRGAVEALPPLPAVALRVMQVAQDPRSSASDLALVISSDPGLSARILRVVNSAAYRRSREVTSVQEALVVLGFIQARNIAISSAITSAYAPDTQNSLFHIAPFWRHSIAVAFKCSEIAGLSRKLDVPSSFTAGILHNMGRLAMFHADPKGIDNAVQLALGEGISLEEAEERTLGYNHAAIGGELARKWNLPTEIIEAIAQHHSAEPGTATLAGAVAFADQYCIQHSVLPGYELPVAEDEETPVRPQDFVRLMKQVDTLMEMITGDPGRISMKAA
jgi:putative nucleotidyltransferase with HDIG domain